MSFHSNSTIFVKDAFFRGLYHCYESSSFKEFYTYVDSPRTHYTSCALPSSGADAWKSIRQFPVRVSEKMSTDCFQTEEIHGIVHKQTPLGKLRETNCVPAGQRQLEFLSTDSSRLQPGVWFLNLFSTTSPSYFFTTTISPRSLNIY